jgi:arginyl-tRNA synthetase
VYHTLEARIREALDSFLARRGVADVNISTERPPNLAMGELATPVAFELAKRLRRAPRQIAREIADELGEIPGVARIETAGAGYVNFFLDRAAVFLGDGVERRRASAGAPRRTTRLSRSSSIPTSIPIRRRTSGTCGMPRWAIPVCAAAAPRRTARGGAKLYRQHGRPGGRRGGWPFRNIEENAGGRGAKRLAAGPRFDYLCWDLYARVSHFYEEDKKRLELRGRDPGGHRSRDTGAAAELAEIVSVAISRVPFAHDGPPWR